MMYTSLDSAYVKGNVINLAESLLVQVSGLILLRKFRCGWYEDPANE